MRCGEWWASLPDLRGSQYPYPLLPTTHLADFLSARWMILLNCCADIYIYILFLLCGGLLRRWSFSIVSRSPPFSFKCCLVLATHVLSSCDAKGKLFRSYSICFLLFPLRCTICKLVQDFERHSGSKQPCYAVWFSSSWGSSWYHC